MNEYFDSYGLMRMNKDIPVENGILFTAYYVLFQKLLGEQIINTDYTLASTYSTKTNYFRANPPEDTDHFSHDNMKGLYFLSSEDERKKLPVLYWNGTYRLHPNTWMVLLAAKFKVFNFLFYPFIAFMAIWSQEMSNRGDTSGNILWFLCLNMLGYNKLVDKYINKYEIVSDFKYYITNGGNWDNLDNPLYKLVVRL